MDICGFLNSFITFGLTSGALTFKQVLLFIFTAGPIGMMIWKIRGIVAFFNDVKNSKINELQCILERHNLSEEVCIGLKDEIERIVSYRITGISDVLRQKVIWQLYKENRNLIQVGFFKKFRSFLTIENNHLVFKKGKSFWIENGILGVFSLQFLALSVSFLFLSLNQGQLIPLWVHSIFYLSALVLFLFFISFAQMIPRPEECKLLEGILHHQDVDV